MKKYEMTLSGDISTLRRAFCSTQSGCNHCPLHKLSNGFNIACEEIAEMCTDEVAQIIKAKIVGRENV